MCTLVFTRSANSLDRINIIRGDFKKCAVACLAGHYHLADLEEAEVKRRVEDLLKDHRYIFPVDKKAGGKLRFDQPFAHPAIIHMLKELGFSEPSFVTEHLELFPTIPEKPDERELPVPLLAIPATALYAGFVELRMTGSRQPTLFTEDAFEDIYRNHVAAIELNRRDAPKATHKLLHGLFNQVIGENPEYLDGNVWKISRKVVQIAGKLELVVRVVPQFCVDALKARGTVANEFGGSLGRGSGASWRMEGLQHGVHTDRQRNYIEQRRRPVAVESAAKSIGLLQALRASDVPVRVPRNENETDERSPYSGRPPLRVLRCANGRWGANIVILIAGALHCVVTEEVKRSCGGAELCSRSNPNIAPLFPLSSRIDTPSSSFSTVAGYRGLWSSKFGISIQYFSRFAHSAPICE
ncbi:hypothetical protein B0H14DRAFT_3170128 [Mycena olivaceomarginata]|nr:hypothetical protein B0H14DRAFT_3170128 [Mycena olivaceomarginata]